MQRLSVFSCLLVLLLVASVECEDKRTAMGGSAFGGLDRIPIAYLQKFYRQRNSKRDPSDFDKYMGFGPDSTYY